MSAFQDQLAADIDVFLNSEEHAELHRINDKSGVACILDTKDEPIKKGYPRYEGFGKSTLTLNISAADLPDGVLSRKIISVDGQRYTILDSVSELGMYDLTLEAAK
jgi:hypothetical protein